MNYDYNLYQTTPAPKKNKSKTAVAALLCVAALLAGGGIGFGASQLYIGYAGIMNGDSGYREVDFPQIPVTTDVSQISANSGNLAEPKTDGAPYSAAELFELVKDTVVGIKINDGYGKTTGVIGSGVVFSTDGYILTCDHVVAGAKKVYVVVDDYDDPTKQNEYEAVVQGSDESTDLAVIKINRDEPFKAAALGKSGDLKIGHEVCAIGNPVELEKTMTKGIVSGLKRDLSGDAYVLPSIQIDAAVNPGNSGCPLFDMYGNVVGIVNIKIVYGAEIDNLGFAISIDEAKPIINELLENGAISRAMLGISAREITNAAMMGIDVEKGLLVDSVKSGTPAAASDLSRGDIITKIDGIEVGNVNDVHNIIKDKKAGDMVKVTVVRYDNYGEKKTLVIEFALTSNNE